MPSVPSRIRTGNSKRSKPSEREKRQAIRMATAEPISVAIFMKRANPSAMKAPPSVAPCAPPSATATAASEQDDDCGDVDRRRGPLPGEHAEHQQRHRADRQDQLRQDQRDVDQTGISKHAALPYCEATAVAPAMAAW